MSDSSHFVPTVTYARNVSADMTTTKRKMRMKMKMKRMRNAPRVVTNTSSGCANMHRARSLMRELMVASGTSWIEPADMCSILVCQSSVVATSHNRMHDWTCKYLRTKAELRQEGR